MLGSDFDNNSSFEQNLNNSIFSSSNNDSSFDAMYSDYTHSQAPASFDMTMATTYSTLDHAGGVQHAEIPLPTAQMPPPPAAPPSNAFICDRCGKRWSSQTDLK